MRFMYCFESSSELLPPILNKESSLPLDLLFTDVWGPALMSSFAYGSWYYLLIVDNATKYNWIFPIEWKSQVKEVFIKFKSQIER